MMSVNLLHRAIVGTMPLVPRPIVWRFSRRYIAGTHLEDAYATIRQLNAEGSTATIDVLGEDSTDDEQVEAALQLYFRALRDIQSASLRTGISVKLSELGLRYDIERCESAMDALLKEAGKHDVFVRIDMEDSSVTAATLDIYKKARERYDRVGVAIQSCLRRSEDDIVQLLSDGQTDIRVCKGIYLEPEEISYRDAEIYCWRMRRPGLVSRHTIRRWCDTLLKRSSDLEPARIDTSSKCSSALPDPLEESYWPLGMPCACTCPSASSGSSTRCAGCARIRTCSATSSETCSPAADARLLAAHRPVLLTS